MSLSTNPVWTYLSNCFAGAGVAYIYLLISKKWEAVYVGQTNSAGGTISRACQHLSLGGTLRVRFEERVGVDLEEADDLFLVSYALPLEPEFISEESSYREAVEYLVQSKLHDLRGDVEPPFKLISEVRYSSRASSAVIDQCANDIVHDFRRNYSTHRVTESNGIEDSV